MAVLVFPGQGSQHVGMGKELYDTHEASRVWFEKADDILGFSLSDIMFNGSEDDLKQTKVTQPAVFLNSFIRYKLAEADLKADAVAGHSLGEFTALIANNVLSFEDGLTLVSKRAMAMQKACDATEGTMAAILGLEDAQVEDICNACDGTVVAANYNCPGQLVISGEIGAINEAVAKATEAGARRALVLNVGGAFHSPLMASAQEELSEAIAQTTFNEASAPIFQNVNGLAETNPDIIKENLIKQLTHSVRWTQTMQNMLAQDHKQIIEFGARVLSGFFKRVDRSLDLSQL